MYPTGLVSICICSVSCLADCQISDAEFI